MAPDPPPGSSRSFVATDHDPPNALAMATIVDPLPTGAHNITGLEQVFTDHEFAHVVVGVDVRIDSLESKTDGTVATGSGFLLLSNISKAAGESSLCIALVLVPSQGIAGQAVIGMLLLHNALDCLTVDNQPGDASGGPMVSDPDAGGDGRGRVTFLANVFLRQWFRLTLDVKRDADGGGTIDFRVPTGGAMAPPTIPPGSMGAGYPGLGIATDVTGPSGKIEFEFDNVTVDFPAN